jgi:hypothetical protein
MLDPTTTISITVGMFSTAMLYVWRVSKAVAEVAKDIQQFQRSLIMLPDVWKGLAVVENQQARLLSDFKDLRARVNADAVETLRAERGSRHGI